MSGKATLRSSEQGIASLLFSMVMMIVISLIVLSFAQIARNGQRNVLDNQLSNQAFLAAESGVNDVSALLRRELPTAVNIAAYNKQNCQLAGSAYASLSGQISPGVSYTCVKVNVTPSSQVVNAAPGTSKVLYLRSSSVAINQITLTWNKETNSPVGDCPAGANTNAVFTPSGSWNCPYGLVRFDLVPLSAISRDALRNNTMAVFAVPTSSGGTGSQLYVAGAARPSAICTDTNCRLTVNVPANSYAMRITSKYKTANVTVTARTIGGAAVNFVGGQAMIDVTGRAQDVSRRIQVRMPLNASGQMPGYALQTSDSICKRFEIRAGDFQNDSTCPLPN